jgi:hypothetical protein
VRRTAVFWFSRCQRVGSPLFYANHSWFLTPRPPKRPPITRRTALHPCFPDVECGWTYPFSTPNRPGTPPGNHPYPPIGGGVMQVGAVRFPVGARVESRGGSFPRLTGPARPTKCGS